jgi:hypothetical protein
MVSKWLRKNVNIIRIRIKKFWGELISYFLLYFVREEDHRLLGGSQASPVRPDKSRVKVKTLGWLEVMAWDTHKGVMKFTPYSYQYVRWPRLLKRCVVLRFVTLVTMKSTLFWGVKPCSLVEVCRCFGEIYCLLLQVRMTTLANSNNSWSYTFAPWRGVAQLQP